MDKKESTRINNIIDYLDWRGDLPLCDEYPFNELDAAIFSRLAYLNYRAIGYGGKELLSHICEEIHKLPRKKFLVVSDHDLVGRIPNCKRYKNLVISDIAVHNDREIEKQFGAITILLPGNRLFVSYLGTDDSLMGWKEDFNMTFMDQVPSQTEAAQYLEKIANKYPHHQIYIGGHSKGGNIALFAAYNCNKSISDRIIKIYNFDGPGFDTERHKFKRDPKVIAKATTYYPQESIFGRMLEHEEESIVVHSDEIGLMQHDLYSWRVSRDHFITVKNEAKQVNYVMNKSLSNWLNSCTIEQRKLFIDTIFEALCADYGYLSDIRRNPIKAIPVIAKAYKSNTTQEERKEIAGMVGKFLKSYSTSRKENDAEHSKANEKAHKRNTKNAKERRRIAEESGYPVTKAFFQD